MTPTKETMLAWQNRPQQLVAKYIKKSLFPDDGKRSTNRKIPSYNKNLGYEDDVNGVRVVVGSVSDRFRSDSFHLGRTDRGARSDSLNLGC